MKSIIASFIYTVELALVLPDDYYQIDPKSITTIMIDSDYDKNNMPIIYLGLRLRSDLYNKMVLSADEAWINFRLFKSNKSENISFAKPYIEDTFIYSMTTDPNYNESFEQYVAESSIVGETNATETYLEGYIGLLSMKSIDNNKRVCNDIVKNTNVMSVVHNYTNHMKMCIEPFDNHASIRQYIIPPVTSITNLLKYLNKDFSFYKSGYRFFRDFDVTYLLSMSGNPVNFRNTVYNTVIISVRDPLDDKSKINSMEIDRDNQAYIIYVDAEDTSLKIDRMVNNTFNSIIGVDTQGRTQEEVINVPGSSKSTRRPMFMRERNIHELKVATESSSIVLTVSKNEIDSSVLTPNKEYQVKNFIRSKQYDGRYVLSYKKEILIRQDNDFIGSVMFGLRKVSEE